MKPQILDSLGDCLPLCYFAMDYGHDVLAHIYAAVFCFLAIIAATKAQQIKGVLKRFQSAWDVMNTPASTGGVKTKSD
jgi:hypothetical protein